MLLAKAQALLKRSPALSILSLRALVSISVTLILRLHQPFKLLAGSVNLRAPLSLIKLELLIYRLNNDNWSCQLR